MRFGIHPSRDNGSPKKVDKSYVSEFSDFMTHFLEEHPEVIEDRLQGRSLYWDHKVEPRAADMAELDEVPDDRYGFDYSAWRPAKRQGSTGHSR